MTTAEFEEKLNEIQKMKCESQILELKSAGQGCPKRLYDTLSSFSNQDEGGLIIFGVDEQNDYEEAGVYDAQDLQKQVNAQCLQMEPVIRPLFTILEKNGKQFVAAEIPAFDITERPCYYKGQGRMKGSFVRVGDSDERMTEYEVYSYEAFRKKYQDDVREVPRAALENLDGNSLSNYIERLKNGKPNLAEMPENVIRELMSVTRGGAVTMSAALLFSPYPQAYFPQLCITAVVVPGKEIGDVGEMNERFLDNRRIEGNIPQMLGEAIKFVKSNMRIRTIIDPDTGEREDRTDYPITAVREAVLNALVHRDYSIHTEGMPVQILMFEDRMEIKNPGGLYGRMQIDQLGKMQPDTRNPVLATALEVMGVTENRYSGIPTIRRAMAELGLRAPEFADERGSFIVRFYREPESEKRKERKYGEETENLLLFCKVPRTRKEISKFLGITSVSYAIKKHITPLVEQGLIKMSIPDRPGSPRQLYYSEK